MGKVDRDLCAACGQPSEGDCSIHRDGFSDGPTVPLCNVCGAEELPTCEELWVKIAQRRKMLLKSIDNRASTPHWFAEVMRYKLQENESKGSWVQLEFNYHMRCLDQEIIELRSALADFLPYEDSLPHIWTKSRAIALILEAADVANFAMMIADKARKIAELTTITTSEWEDQVRLSSSW